VSYWRRRPFIVEAWQFMPAGQCDELPALIDPQWFCEDIGRTTRLFHRASIQCTAGTAGRLRVACNAYVRQRTDSVGKHMLIINPRLR
jgi:hypothetical protein